MQHWICIDLKSGWSYANVSRNAKTMTISKWPNFAAWFPWMQVQHTFVSKQQRNVIGLYRKAIIFLWMSVIKHNSSNHRDIGPADELPLNKSTHLNALAFIISNVRTKCTLAHFSSVAYVNTLRQWDRLVQ